MTKQNSIVVRAIPHERFCYYVQSQGEPESAHTVNLSQHSGLGCCTCQDYRIRVESAQRRAIAKNPEPHAIEYRPNSKQREGRTQCKHIWAANQQFDRKNKRPFLAGFTEGDPTTTEGWTKRLYRILNWKGRS